MGVLKGISLLCVTMLLADCLFGSLWANMAKRLFRRLSSIALRGAVMDVYHDRLDVILRLLSHRIGSYFPKQVIVWSMLATFVLVFAVGLFAHAILEDLKLRTESVYDLLAFCVGGTLSASFCYTITYMVLTLVRDSRGTMFAVKYLYLVTLEVLLSYLLAPLGYAALFLLFDAPGEQQGGLADSVRMFVLVVTTWPSSVIAVSYKSIDSLQSGINAVLLLFSVALCVLPTVAHVGLLLVDIARFLLSKASEHLMSAFEKLERRPARVRILLLGAISGLSSIGWLLS